MSERIRLPTLPAPSEKPGFPVLASAAPVIGALAMWMLTQSPYSLLFAILGPLVAIGGLIDARRRQRKAIRAARARFEAERLEVRERIDRVHARERRELARRAVGSLDILTQGRPTHERWHHDEAAPLEVSLGTGTVASSLVIDGPGADELASRAARLAGAPVLVDAATGVAVVGESTAALALVRALVLQLAHTLSPDRVAVTVETGADGMLEPELEWLSTLPHARPAASEPEARPSRAHATVRFTRRTEADASARARVTLATVVLARSAADLPREVRSAVHVGGTRLGVTRWPDPEGAPAEIRANLLTRASAHRLAGELRTHAVTDGLLHDDSVPSRVSVTELGEPPPGTAAELACAFGLGAGRAPVTVDLVGEGPHALVGGTTGSGKSELLCAWIHSLAARYSPHELNLLLIDFKGGASFRTVESLPHIVGCVTDLDAAEASRALDSLSAELRRREQRLAELGARDIADLDGGTLPRLVIVIDEYAALVAEHANLHSVFTDIAARGRSLGVHLILATQRPSGIVRESILANMPLRVSLRVLEPADSTATIGSPEAAHLAGAPPGRALVTSPKRPVTSVQPALITAQDAAATRHRHGDPECFAPRRPWLPPLPTRVTRAELIALEPTPRPEPDGIPFALVDRPASQRRGVARLDLRTSSHLLIVGARGSGRTSAIAALAESARESGLPVRMLPADIEGVWDAVHEQHAAVRSGEARPGMVLADDIDLALSRLPEEHRDALTRTLTGLLAEGPACGIALALSVARVGAITSALAAHCDARLVLRTTDQHEHHAAGGDPRRFSPDLPPGRGWYRGELVHVVAATTDATMRDESVATPTLPRQTRAIVTTTPTVLIDRLARAWGDGSVVPLTRADTTTAHASAVTVTGDAHEPVFVADPDTWQTRFALLTELSRASTIAYHDCSVAQFRQLSGNRALPPPLAQPVDSAWLAHPAAPVTRARLPRL